MTSRSRAQRLNAAFVAVADTLGPDYQAHTLMQALLEECTALLDVHEGGVLLTAPGGELVLAASTSEHAFSVQMLQIGAGSGPSFACFDSGEQIVIDDIAAAGGDWPEFQHACLERGIHSVYLLPLRLRDRVVGSMALFGTQPNALDADGTTTATALAQVATIGMLLEREIRAGALIADQLSRALGRRVVIEQAKGMLVGAGVATIDDAHTLMRSYARGNNLTLGETAGEIVARRIIVTETGLTALALPDSSLPDSTLPGVGLAAAESP